MYQRSRQPRQSVITLQSDDLQETYGAINAIEQAGGQILHVYGPRVLVGHVPARARTRAVARVSVRDIAAEPVSRAPGPISETERLGLEAWNVRQSPAFAAAKAERPRAGEPWDAPGAQTPGPGPHPMRGSTPAASPRAAEDMSPYLIGSVALGIVIVSGPSPDLQFSQVEAAKVVAEIQDGLG